MRSNAKEGKQIYSLAIKFIMEQKQRPPEHTSIKVLLDCSNTLKVNKSVAQELSICPWNHRLKKEKTVLRNARNITFRGLSGTRRISSLNAKQEWRRKVVDLNQGLEEQHSRRKREFILRKTRRHSTISKIVL